MVRINRTVILAFLALILLPTISVADTPMSFPLSSQINGGGNIYSSNSIIDFCGVYNSISDSKLPPCPLGLKINETFSQSVNEKITILNGSVINGSAGTINLGIDTQVPSSNVNLKYNLLWNDKVVAQYTPLDSPQLNLGQNPVTEIKIPIVTLLGGATDDVVDDIVNYLVEHGVDQGVAYTAINKLINLFSISGQFISTASLVDQISGQGFGHGQNITWTSEGSKSINFTFVGQSDTQKLTLTPSSRQNLSLGFGLAVSNYSLNFLSTPIRTASNFSDFQGSPMNLSWYKVTIEQQGTAGQLSPSQGIRWYVQGYVIQLNATPYNVSGFYWIIQPENGAVIHTNQTSYDYNVESPTIITANFSNQPPVPVSGEIVVIVIVIIIVALLFASRRNNHYGSRYGRY